MNINWDEILTLEDLKQAKNKIYAKGSELFELQQQIRSASPEEKK
nr:hypothetical protein [Mycoplasmopsis columbina]